MSVSDLLTELIHDLSETIRAWETFSNRDISALQDAGQTKISAGDMWGRALHENGNTFDDLQHLRMELVYLNDRYKDSRREVSGSSFPLSLSPCHIRILAGLSVRNTNFE